VVVYNSRDKLPRTTTDHITPHLSHTYIVVRSSNEMTLGGPTAWRFRTPTLTLGSRIPGGSTGDDPAECSGVPRGPQSFGAGHPPESSQLTHHVSRSLSSPSHGDEDDSGENVVEAGDAIFHIKNSRPRTVFYISRDAPRSVIKTAAGCNQVWDASHFPIPSHFSHFSFRSRQLLLPTTCRPSSSCHIP
jgi:hypothetical protein